MSVDIENLPNVMYVISLTVPDHDGYQNAALYEWIGITPPDDAPVASWPGPGAKSLASLSQNVGIDRVWRWPSDLLGQQILTKWASWYSSFEVHRLGWGLRNTEDEQENNTPYEQTIKYVHRHQRIKYHASDTVTYHPRGFLTETFKERHKIFLVQRLMRTGECWKKARKHTLKVLFHLNTVGLFFATKAVQGYYFRVIKRSLYDSNTGTTGGSSSTGDGSTPVVINPNDGTNGETPVVENSNNNPAGDMYSTTGPRGRYYRGRDA